jgi:hypothetical protein
MTETNGNGLGGKVNAAVESATGKLLRGIVLPALVSVLLAVTSALAGVLIWNTKQYTKSIDSAVEDIGDIASAVASIQRILDVRVSKDLEHDNRIDRNTRRLDDYDRYFRRPSPN